MIDKTAITQVFDVLGPERLCVAWRRAATRGRIVSWRSPTARGGQRPSGSREALQAAEGRKGAKLLGVPPGAVVV